MLRRGKYDGVNDQHFSEKLVEIEGLHTVYGDRHSSLKRERQALDARGRASWQARTTQVGRVLANLGVEMRYALSAPAKGRVERLWGVLQDRLISELRLAGASTLGQAN